MSNVPPTIGRYEILGSIGRGGMGSLYLALDPKLDRQLAIKLLRDDDDDLRERFAREARAAARLRHPNIVTIFDVGEHDGQPFIAMEYIQGQTLAEIVRGNVSMTLVRKLELMESLCDGLGFAHKGGIIHRDIKPANLMIDADGSLKILDFGIARASESSGMTQAGMLIGTLNYMSPEQVSGQPIDLRSDLFAVGAVFYELVSYRQAFPGGLMAGILNKIMSGQPDPLTSLVPDVDAEVVRIIERALEKDPDRRYADLSAMRQEIVLARARLGATEPMRVLGTTPGADDGETRFTPPPSSGSRRTTDLEGLARRRAEQIQSHLADAESKLAAGDADGAIASAEQALLLDPNHGRGHGLVDRARSILEAQQLDAALDAAAGGIASGDFQVATEFLARAADIDPKAPRLADVRRSLDDAVQRQEEARQREALEARVREVIADAERQFAEGRRDDGVAALAAFRPSHPLVAQALERLRADAARLAEEDRAAAERRAKQAEEVAERTRREEETRRARERERAATDAIKEAKRARGPEAALAILRPALERDPDNVDLLRAVGANEAELQRAQAKAAEEARRQAEKVERERAERERLDREKAEREKAERERAERERIEREKAARQKAAAPQMIPGIPSADVDDRTVMLKRDAPKPVAPAAPPVAVSAEPTPAMPMPMPMPLAKAPAPAAEPETRSTAASVAKTPEPIAATPAALRTPSPPAPPSDESVVGQPAEPGGISNAVKYGGAAAAVLLVVMGFVLFGGGSPDAPSTSGVMGTTSGEIAADPAAAPPVDEAPLVDAGADADTVSQGETAAVVPTPTTVPVQTPAQQVPPPPQQQQRPGTSAQEQQLDRLLADAQQLRGGGDLRTALERVEDALKIRQNDARFTGLANSIRQEAEQRATAARGQAQSVGQPALALVTYGEGEKMMADARAQAAAGDASQAARVFMAAETRYRTAATEGQRAVDGQRLRQEQEQAQQRELENQKANAANVRVAEEAAIRNVVEQYRLGYSNNDADAVARVFPSVNAQALRKGFSGYTSQSMTLSNIVVTLAANATTATVRAQMELTVQPRAGSRRETRAAIALDMRKNGNTWIIAARHE